MNSGKKVTPADKRAPARSRPTLKTIAYMTGLGVTTVSRALKDAPDIAERTKERVRLVAKQLGYMPNRAGVRLRTGKTNVIALLMTIDEEIMGMSSQMIYGISEVLAETPYHLVLMPQPLSVDPMTPVRYVLDTGSADGILISRIEPNDARVNLLLESNFPFAAHGRMTNGAVFPFHDFDNEAFGLEAVERLNERGRKRIVCLQPPSHLTYYNSFRRGFEQGLHRFGAEEVPLTSVNTDGSLDSIREAFMKVLTAPNPPDGIISCSGGGTIPIIATLQECRRILGNDIDLVAKQPADLLNWINPKLITMSEDFRQAGRELASAVLERIDDRGTSPRQSISKPDWTKKI